jgi:heme exporter protein A
MAEGDALDARRLCARRGHATLFRNVGFAIGAGEGIVVTGPNGSGKTTLLRMLAGLTAPSEGEIRWRGEPVSPFDARLRAAVAFNGHPPALKDELTPAENLAAWIALDGRGASAAEIAAALDAVALGRQRALPVRVLSQGQRRRIGLARLRMVRHPLWILDEPVTALDAEGSAMLGDVLAAHLQRGGLCVAASHQPLPLAGARLRSLALAPALAP